MGRVTLGGCLASAVVTAIQYFVVCQRECIVKHNRDTRLKRIDLLLQFFWIDPVIITLTQGDIAFRLLRNRNFWLLTIGIGLLYGSDQALVTSTVPYFQDIGIDLSAAAVIMSCITVSAIAGKLLVGYLADKVDLRYVFLLVVLMHVALLVTFLLQPPYWVLLIMSVAFGVGIGGVFPVWATFLAHLFGSHSYGTAMGLMTIILKLFSILAVRLIGEIYDFSGSYETAFMIFIGVVLSALVAAMFIKKEAY